MTPSQILTRDALAYPDGFNGATAEERYSAAAAIEMAIAQTSKLVLILQAYGTGELIDTTDIAAQLARVDASLQPLSRLP